MGTLRASPPWSPLFCPAVDRLVPHQASIQRLEQGLRLNPQVTEDGQCRAACPLTSVGEEERSGLSSLRQVLKAVWRLQGRGDGAGGLVLRALRWLSPSRAPDFTCASIRFKCKKDPMLREEVPSKKPRRLGLGGHSTGVVRWPVSSSHCRGQGRGPTPAGL